MSFQEDRKKRDAFLVAAYKEAKATNPVSPLSVIFGLSKTRSYNLKSREFVNNDQERSGYLLGERLHLTEIEVDTIVNELADSDYVETGIGNLIFYLKRQALKYLEKLEEPNPPVQVKHTQINIGTAHGPVQIQQEVSGSNQTQKIFYSYDQIKELFDHIREDISNLPDSIKQEFTSEMDYATKQAAKGKSVDVQLANIGDLIKNVGIGVMGSLMASPIWELLKPFFGF